jgi:hypothetical protein
MASITIALLPGVAFYIKIAYTPIYAYMRSRFRIHNRNRLSGNSYERPYTFTLFQKYPHSLQYSLNRPIDLGLVLALIPHNILCDQLYQTIQKVSFFIQ